MGPARARCGSLAGPSPAEDSYRTEQSVRASARRRDDSRTKLDAPSSRPNGWVAILHHARTQFQIFGFVQTAVVPAQVFGNRAT